MEEREKSVRISLDEFVYLLKCKEKLNTFLSGVYDGATLNWDKSELRLDDSAVSMLLKVIDRENYLDILRTLTKADEE